MFRAACYTHISMETTMIWLALILVLIGLFWWYLQRLMTKQQQSLREANEQSLQELLAAFYKQSSESFLQLANDKLQSKQQEYKQDLDRRKDAIESIVKTLQNDIVQYRQQMHQLEKERVQQFGSLAQQMKGNQDMINVLRDSTEKLTNLLSNNRLRGNWGERTLEDIMQRVGFIKGQDYVVQTQLSSTGKRPDFIINLSNGKKVCIDVKFPLDNLRKYYDATTDAEKVQALRQFRTDILAKVKDVSSREYISAEENTVDFAIIFVPSEMVYSLIHNNMSEVVDDALARKIVFTSPFAFYTLVQTISEANRAFRYEKNIQKVLALIETLSKDYGRFQDEFNKVGTKLKQVQDAYLQVAQTRFNKLEKDFTMIKGYQQDTAPTPKQPSLPDMD